MIILTPPLESFKYQYQIGEHAENTAAMCREQGIERGAMGQLAYVEFLITEAAHTGDGHEINISEARKKFDQIDDVIKSTQIGRKFAEILNHEEFLIMGRKLMIAAIPSGICKMSKSGKHPIFTTPTLGRVDLAGFYPHARHQLETAGLIEAQ